MSREISKESCDMVADLLAVYPPFSICDIVCNGECTVVASLRKSGFQMCKEKIAAYLFENCNAENEKD